MLMCNSDFYLSEKTIFDLTIEDPVWGYRAVELFWKDVYYTFNGGSTT